jgi:hypothetical protein
MVRDTVRVNAIRRDSTRFNAKVCDFFFELTILIRSHRVAQDWTARCVLWAHRLRLCSPPPPLIRIQLNVSCSARRTAAAASRSKNTATTGAPMTGGTEEKTTARRSGKPIGICASVDGFPQLRRGPIGSDRLCCLTSRPLVRALQYGRRPLPTESEFKI